jgi:hypothetical protein
VASAHDGILTLDANTAHLVNCSPDGWRPPGLNNCAKLDRFVGEVLARYAFGFNEHIRTEYSQLMGVSSARLFLAQAMKRGRAVPVDAEPLPEATARLLRTAYALSSRDKRYLEVAFATDTRTLVSHDDDFRRMQKGRPRGRNLAASVRRECGIRVQYVDECVACLVG